jgi:hypothetical protein
VQGNEMAAASLLDRLMGQEFIAVVPRVRSSEPFLSDADPELMTTQELAQLMRVDPSSVRRWRTAVPMQGPPFIRLSSRVVKYRRDDVERWLADRRVNPEAA